MVERVPTGIKGFDALIEGGLPKGSVTLVSGTPGTGKSIFCSQIAYNNAVKGKKCLYLNLEQDEGKMKGQLDDLGWDINKVAKNLKVVTVDTTDSKVVEYILKEIARLNYDMIILDSLDSIFSVPPETEELASPKIQTIAEHVVPTTLDMTTIGRMRLKEIFSAINKSKATTLLTAERVEGADGISRDTISEFLCDGIITMHYLGVGSSEYRSMRVIKMRRSGHEKDYISFDINKKGIKLKQEESIRV